MTDETIDDALIDAYLARLGLARPLAPTLENLNLLVGRHIAVVPFENIDIFERVPIALGTRRAVEKLVTRRRGGFCFEINEAFRGLLATLGYEVRRIEGRVWAAPEQRFGVPFDHLALVVSLPEGEYLADIGFGDNNRRPMRLPEDEVSDVSGVYRLRPNREGFWLLECLPAQGQASARPLYEATLGARPLSAYATMCEFHQTASTSIFTRGLICTLPTNTGRITLTHNRLIHVENGTRRERAVESAHDRAELLQFHFGIQERCWDQCSG